MFALLFPGQGSQVIGMGKTLWDNFSVAKSLLREAEDILSEFLSQVMFEGPEETLKETRYAQPAIFVHAMMIHAVLQEEFGVNASCFAATAGHSLGEYSALCAARSISFADALLLIKKRCEEMSLVKNGGMTAILGLSREEVENVLTHLKSEDGVCEIANDNTPKQIVISGYKDAVEKAALLAKEHGALRCVPLMVSGPFHSSLMKSAEEKFAAFAENIPVLSSVIPIYTNVSAAPHWDGKILKHHLIHQISHGVRWSETQENMAKNGIKAFVELGGNGVLSGLARKTIPTMETHLISSMEDILTFPALAKIIREKSGPME